MINCAFTGNAANNGAGIYNSSSNPRLSSCNLWQNSDAGGMDESSQIFNSESSSISNPIVNYCNIQGGWTGAGGVGNINADPLFVDPDNSDFRLAPGSPCIDAGDNDALPVDVTTDLAGNPRFIDNGAVPNTGNPGAVGPPIVDMGAFEASGDCNANAISDETEPDADGDTIIDDCDNCDIFFNPTQRFPVADVDTDCDVDGSDFAKFAQCFNGAGNPPRTLGCLQN